MKRLFGLIGYPLEHSGSPAWFADRFRREGISDAEYRLFPLNSADRFPALIKGMRELAGLNVTIPYKETIIPYLDHLDTSAAETGAVNVISIRRHGSLISTTGFNTDTLGFLKSLEVTPATGPALVLGTGGAAKAVARALRMLNISYRFVSRVPAGAGILTYQELTEEIIRQHPFIINTTPLGMYPATDGFPPIPYQHLQPSHLLYDLIYNPPETEFLKRGAARHTLTRNGRQMLEEQAALSLGIFLGQESPMPGI